MDKPKYTEFPYEQRKKLISGDSTVADGLRVCLVCKDRLSFQLYCDQCASSIRGDWIYRRDRNDILREDVANTLATTGFSYPLKLKGSDSSHVKKIGLSPDGKIVYLYLDIGSFRFTESVWNVFMNALKSGGYSYVGTVSGPKYILSKEIKKGGG